jgi:hypothetical protein
MNPKHLMTALVAASALAGGTLLPGSVLADGRHHGDHHGQDHGWRHVAKHKHKHKHPRRIIHEHRYYRDYVPARRYYWDDGYCPDYGGRTRFRITYSGGWD